ncbi:creatininase family protein [Massilia sp. Mn16-1_5]|uniref:creatininase family protein n=1 Tax=Massilia sp. Mn16-1_5 TaxID=2079199 RepID=UPI00109ECA54|nr:creatininase family protein [Massilia sp. Mn16-1_5]THC45355.1 creatininase [Massilia sp. Mn16-1_5]
MLHTNKRRQRTAFGAAILALGLAASTLAAAREPASVYVEDLTSPEVQARIDKGATTVLVPIGGLEQSGPHIALGKHNVRARVLAGRIAQSLGSTLVAPVVAYVPEGLITPPSGHMRFAGTVSIPDSAFEAVLEATARSFCQHGVRAVFFLGDHGGYQKNEEKAAARVNRLGGCRVHALLEYYGATQTSYVAELKRRGHGEAEIGLHAGLADTALTLALDPALVRTELLAPGARAGKAGGVAGDPTRASTALGQLGVDRIVAESVAAIRAQLATQLSKPALQNPSRKP